MIGYFYVSKIRILLKKNHIKREIFIDHDQKYKLYVL